MVWVITSKYWENFIISAILINSLLLGIKDYTDYSNLSKLNRFIESAEPFFTYTFLLECSLKILGMGFILGSNSYLTDSWNWLDFIVVVTSLLQ